MKTVGDLLQMLEGLDRNMPVIAVDTRSGVVEHVSFGAGTFRSGDNEYGVEDIAVGTPIFNVYMG